MDHGGLKSGFLFRSVRAVKRDLIHGGPGQRRIFMKKLYRKNPVGTFIERALTALSTLATSSRLKRRLAAGGYNGVILYYPPFDWNYLFQRPQQLSLALAGQGYVVVYLSEGIYDSFRGIRQISENLFVVNASPYRVARLLGSDGLTVFASCSCRLSGMDAIPCKKLVYDYYDDFEVFESIESELHARMVQSADLTLVTAEKLHNGARNMGGNVLLCPNAADYAHFHSKISNHVVPADMAWLAAAGKPVIGYYGAFARWFDYDLIKFAAKRRPDWNFLLIGPNLDNTLTSAGLEGFGNVNVIGQKDYGELPDYLQCFSVATIPFRINDITLATSPVKLFEYMAGGKPVVTTALPECMKYPGVFVAEDYEGFLEKIEDALAKAADPAYLAVIDSVARQNTWDARARQILKAIGEL